MNTGTVDIVVTWVDGNDPEWLKEKAKYSSNTGDNSASNNRFRDWDLMRYWFRGVEKYAPWVNHIFFVTCGHYPKWLNLSNPKLTVVKHEDYIDKSILPTFNSNTIEMHMHNIEGLSEKFICFNDDIFFISDTVEEDFFVDDLPCESALLGVLSSQKYEDVFPHTLLNNNAILNKYFSKKEVLNKNKSKFFSHKYGKDVFRNIALLPFVYFSDFRDLHLCVSHKKSYFKEIWNLEPDLMEKATSSRFRSKNDVTHWLVKDWYLCKGEFYPRNTKWGRKFELGVEDGAYDYIVNHRGKIVCLNDSIEDLDFDVIKEELHEAFGKILPEKSSFEI